MGKIDGRVAFITGGARGIGRAIAEELALEGAKIIIADMLEDEGRKTAHHLDKTYGQGSGRFVKLDVTQEDEWVKIAADMKDEGIDILVNNAGILSFAPLEMIDLSEWQRIFAINVEGVFLSCKHIAPILRDNASKWQGGASIINISSMAGKVGAPGFSAYCASKAAVKLLTKSLALEYAAVEPLIRVNSIHPGVVDTQMGDQLGEAALLAGLASDEKSASEAIKALHPMGRLAKPQEIARAVLFLASADSSFSTGSEMVVDGGVTTR